MTKVVWSGKAKKEFRNVIDYLFEKWTINEVQKFNHKVSELVKNIADNTAFCPKSRMTDLRKCLINKNNFLVYLFKNEIIYIVTLIDNKSSHLY